MQITENTVNGWSGVIADLTAKRQAAREHLEQLRAQKRDRALEAAMGGGDAKRRLETINAELTKLAFEVDDWDVAVSQAEAEKCKAEAQEAGAAERARQERLSVLATTAIQHSAEFTDALQHAVKAANGVRAAIRNMIALCSPDEQRGPAVLLRAPSFMRAAERVGLRDFLEFAAYAGPQSHVVALEDEAAVHLRRWRKLPSQDPPEGSGNEEEE